VEGKYIMRSLVNCTAPRYCTDDQTGKNEVREACSTWGQWRDIYTGILYVNLRERGHLEDPGVDGSIILIWIFRK